MKYSFVDRLHYVVVVKKHPGNCGSAGAPADWNSPIFDYLAVGSVRSGFDGPDGGKRERSRFDYVAMYLVGPSVGQAPCTL